MATNLKRRLALVTGSSGGLGKAIAIALAKEGIDIIVNGRNTKKVVDTICEIGDNYDVNVHGCYADATKTDEVKEFFKENSRWLTKLDILVNNVGNAGRFGSFIELEDKDWIQCYDLSCLSAIRFTREALPLLTASGQGRIINISSLSSHQPGYFNMHYAMAKAAMNTMTKYMANDFGNRKILVNTVCPSTLEGGAWEHNIKDRAKRNELSLEEAEHFMRYEEYKKSPLGEMGKLQDVANLVSFLASDKAGFLTGHCYNVDGGITKGV